MSETTEVHETESVAAAQIAELRVTLRADKFSGPEWDAHRQLQASVARLSNGERNSMAAQSDALCRIATVITQDRLREPYRLAEALRLIHSCPIQPLMTKGPNGMDVMPWVPAIQNAIAGVEQKISDAAKTQEIDTSSFSFMGATFRGKTVIKYAVSVIAGLAVVWMILARQDAAFEDMKRTTFRDIQQNFLPEIRKAMKAQTLSLEDKIDEADRPAK